jgi:hypothetical protein
MPNTELHETAAALVAEGKGILAADESTGTIKKRFDTIGVESTEENRRAYRNLLFTTPGAEEYVSGVILYDETIRQKADDGTPFPELLASKGVIPGIKVDEGAKPLAHADGETVTEGLDGLRQRLEEYRGLGARFAKWRATYSITDTMPSEWYSARRSRRPSRPSVTVSPSAPASGLAPRSTLMPGMMPWASSSSTRREPSEAFWRMVSSNRITPLMKSAAPFVVKSISR